MRWGLLTKNPADAVDLPRRIRPDTNALTTEDLHRLLGAIEHADKWRIPLLIAIGTGMRRGEILALQWQDYRPEQHQLVVRRALSHISAKHIVVKEQYVLRLMEQMDQQAQPYYGGTYVQPGGVLDRLETAYREAGDEANLCRILLVQSDDAPAR